MTYDSLSDPSAPKVEETVKAGVALMVGFTTSAPEGLEEWYNKEHLALLCVIPGWVRSRRYVFVGGGRAGRAVEETDVPSLMALHEFVGENALASAEFKTAMSTEWRVRVMKTTTVSERRMFKVFEP